MRIAKVEEAKAILHGGSAASFTQATARFRNMPELGAYLRRMATEWGNSLPIKELAMKIIREAGAASRDEQAQALAIGTWVQKHVYYVHEGKETFQQPPTTLKLRAGDCDDMTTLICAMLQSVGIKWAMCLVRINRKWAHIFPVSFVRVPGEPGLHRLTLDATLSDPVADMVNPLAKVEGRGFEIETLFV
jgi:hypothetical protein